MSAANTGSRSCNTCPAFLKDREANTRVLGATVEGPMCGLKLIPIGRPGVSEENIATTVATKCDKYGTPLGTPNLRNSPVLIQVAMPDSAFPERDQEDKSCRSCVDCAAYVPPMPMLKKSGWKAGFCRAKGSLILQDRAPQYARGCKNKQRSPHPMTGFDPDGARDVNIFFFPEYQEGYGKIDPLVQLRELWSKNKIDPRKYVPDDLKVSDKGREWGMRGWRRIEDPTGFGPSVRLPLFDPDKLPQEDQAWVPQTGDEEAPELYIDYTGSVYKIAVLWTKLNETPALWGEPGNGKTELYRHMAWLMQVPFTRINFTGSSEIDDIAGKMMYSPDKGTYFHYGRVPQSWVKVNVCCLDEPNTAPNEVWQFIRPLTDNSKQLRLDQNRGEALSRHRCCFMGMAMNPAWDTRNVGAMTLADADGRRLAHLEMPPPPFEVEKLILMQRLERDNWTGPAAESAIDLTLKISADLRLQAAEGNLPVSWGVAQNIKVVRAMEFFKPIEAFRIGIADALGPDEREIMLTAVKSYTEN